MSLSSAQVVRDLQRAFTPSRLFAPMIAGETVARDNENAFQRRRRRDKRVQVKIGHGGTLDPLATGVLVIGVGKGTRQLARFLECTKSYEATLLLGAATDTHDILGQVLARSSVQHVSRTSFENALQGFRGQIEQKPPLYSAIRMEGKRLYEYARQGLPLPAEIQKRPVAVEKLGVTQWLEPGSHSFEFPQEEGTEADKSIASQILNLERSHRNVTGDIGPADPELSDKIDEADTSRGGPRKWRVGDATTMVNEDGDAEALGDWSDPTVDMAGESTLSDSKQKPLAVTLCMTVSSGFYVRSLCHDLGEAVGSLATMAALSRTRQGNFELGRNVLEYNDVRRGEEVWGPKIQLALEEWSAAQKAL